MKKGDKIRYTGDRANQPDTGVIIEIGTDRWCDYVVVKMDSDGHVSKLYRSAFYDGPGCRFQTEADYQAKRQAEIELWEKRRAALEAKRLSTDAGYTNATLKG